MGFIGQNKPVSPEELEALIEAASSPAPIDEKFVDMSSIDRWILMCNVNEGEHEVTPTRLYIAYKRWAKFPLGRNEFFKLAKKKFKRRRGTAKKGEKREYIVYLLNPEPFASVPISKDELLEEMNKGIRRIKNMRNENAIERTKKYKQEK